MCPYSAYECYTTLVDYLKGHDLQPEHARQVVERLAADNTNNLWYANREISVQGQLPFSLLQLVHMFAGLEPPGPPPMAAPDGGDAVAFAVGAAAPARPVSPVDTEMAEEDAEAPDVEMAENDNDLLRLAALQKEPTMRMPRRYPLRQPRQPPPGFVNPTRPGTGTLNLRPSNGSGRGAPGAYQK